MADLMSTLIRPSTSQESFHSTYSTHQPSSPMPSSTDHSTGPLPAHHFTSSQAQDHQSTYDVNAYLDNLANRAYLENSSDGTVPPGPPKYGTRSATTSSEHSRSDNPEPVQLGIPKTSHNVSAFFELCQEKGWTPEFDIQEDLNVGQRFKGSLTVGGQTIHLEEAQPSKKEARQVLSTQGYKLVQQMSARVKCKDDDGERTENWVGKLLGTHPEHSAEVEMVFLSSIAPKASFLGLNSLCVQGLSYHLTHLTLSFFLCRIPFDNPTCFYPATILYRLQPGLFICL